MRDSPENSLVIFMRGGEPWVMNYCWSTPKYRNWYAQHAFFEGKKLRKLPRENVLLELRRRLANSIRPYYG
jgi:hypothetical protein